MIGQAIIEQAREVMRLLTTCTEMDEAALDRFTRAADLAEASGDARLVPIYREEARRQRVKVMMMRARLAAFVQQYGALHLDGRDGEGGARP